MWSIRVKICSFQQAQWALHHVTVPFLDLGMKKKKSCGQMWSGIVAEGCLLFWVFAPSSSHRGQKTGGAFFFFFFRALKNFPSARSPALHSILTFRAEQLQHRNERQNVVYHKVHRRQVEKSIRTRSCRWGRTETEKIQWKTCLNKNPLSR